MKLGWASRCTAVCAAAVLAIPPLATPAQVVAPPNPPAPIRPAPDPAARPPAADQPKLKWSQICSLSLSGGRLVLRCDLTLDALRGLDGSETEVDGMPGSTAVTIVPRRYQVRNQQRVGDDQLTLMVYGTRTGLSLEAQRTTDGKSGGVVYYQTSSDFAGRARRGNDARLTVYGQAAAGGENVTVEASDLVALRQAHPHEVNRHLRPLLRRLGADVFQIEPAVARQVLFALEEEASDPPVPAGTPDTRPAAATGPATPRPAAIDPAVEAKVRVLLAELDAPDFARRESATARLAALGPPAVAALARLDRGRLSSQQNLTIDLLAAAAHPLGPEDARRLRADPHFLIDCLYAPDAAIRAAAADRLTRRARVDPARLAAAVAGDPRKDPDRTGELVERLRDEAVPPPAK